MINNEKKRMKRSIPWGTLLMLLSLLLILQGCLGIGDNSQKGNTITTNSNGNHVNIVQNLFKGKIYFTIDHNLWVTDGKNNTREIMTGGNVYDPAVSPNGKWIVVSARNKNSSDIAIMPVSGGKRHNLLNGSGSYYNDAGFIKSSNHWFAQPAWSLDSSHILFLSDIEKEAWYIATGINAPLLDLQVFSIPFNNPFAKPQDIAYASFGDGGDRDPSYRPGHPTEIVYTHYAYDTATRTQQVIQIFLEDANAIANHPGVFHPGLPGYDPGIAITDPKDQNLQPAFSPDGNAIVYVRRESPSQMGLYVMPVPEGVTVNPNDPKTEQQALLPYKKSSHLLSGQYVSQPTWSRDGKQIAYISYSNNEFDLWLANVAFNAKTGTYSLQGNPVQLTTGGIDGNSRPFWTP
jgi:Tol biopolymer transport system component